MKPRPHPLPQQGGSYVVDGGRLRREAFTRQPGERPPPAPAAAATPAAPDKAGDAGGRAAKASKGD
jgi:hypothetical protein